MLPIAVALIMTFFVQLIGEISMKLVIEKLMANGGAVTEERDFLFFQCHKAVIIEAFITRDGP